MNIVEFMTKWIAGIAAVPHIFDGPSLVSGSDQFVVAAPDGSKWLIEITHTQLTQPEKGTEDE